MTDKEKIKAEIERRRSLFRAALQDDAFKGKDRADVCLRYEELGNIFDFINSLPEEPVSEDLEAEIKRYVYDPYFNLNGVAVKGATEYLTVEDVADIARHFANWQKKQCNNEANHALVEQIKTQQLCYEKGMADMKQQMMKDAVDGRFSYNHNFKEYEFICLEKSDTPEHYIGELVKVIIIKQEEE